MANDGLSHIHHYVPEWYQKRFLEPGESQFYRLDLAPTRQWAGEGKTYVAKACLRRPPSRCFCTNDLYMLRFGQQETDIFEKRFFGEVDRRGKPAVESFANLDGYTRGFPDMFRPLLGYMGAQRFRTPRGLDWLRKISQSQGQAVLAFMARMFQAHGTMWMEGVWEIVRADAAQVKFIVTDSPVTFYNASIPPSRAKYPGTEELDRIGTRTLFPLGRDRCLILTHLQFVRNPTVKAVTVRTNARSFQFATNKFTDIQFGRLVSDEEVRKINFILKRAATKYIAAGREEWLYPEAKNHSLGWANADNDWFLMPNPWRVPFGGETIWGYQDGSSWSVDAYGRNRYDPNYDDQRQRDREWISAQLAKYEWVKRRGYAPRSKTLDFGDEIHDKMIDDVIAEQAAKKK